MTFFSIGIQMKYNEGSVNRLAKVTRILNEAEGPKGPHGWTKELSQLWIEKKNLTIDVGRMTKGTK